MSTPEGDYRDILDKLLGMYFTLPSLRVKADYRSVPHVAHGWYMRCQRGVEAVLLLEKSGYELEAAPIRRSIIEHVVALKWLALNGEVVAGLMKRGAAHDAARRRDAVQEANWTSVDIDLLEALIADADDTDKANDNQLHFRERCDKAGTPHDLVIYLLETAQSHPSWATAEPYIDQTSGTLYSLREPQPQHHVDEAGFCALHLCEALAALNHILRGRPFNRRLVTIELEIRAIAVRQRREQGLPIPPGFDPDEPK